MPGVDGVPESGEDDDCTGKDRGVVETENEREEL